MDTSNNGICAKCKSPITPIYNFCPNCGKELKTKPLNTGISAQIWLYVLSVLLPPFGFGLTWKYIRSDNPAAKRIGIISAVLTATAIAAAGIWSYNYTQKLMEQINSQMSPMLMYQ